MASLIDPTITGNYPVILGDGLLGKTSNDIFTGVRYNHKPTLSSTTAPEQARLKPAIPGKTSSYDLSYNDNGAYAYVGTRTINSNQYVLHFDPRRKAFILDRIDSTFDMNLSRTPTNTDPESLGRSHPHISEEEEQHKPAPASAPVPAAATPASSARAAASRAKSKAKGATNVFAKAPPKSKAKESSAMKKAIKPEKKQVAKNIALDLPKPAANEPAPKPKSKKSLDDDDDEDEEDDEGEDDLLIEYPGAEPKVSKADFSPAFAAVRKFDDYMDQRESGVDEADEESDENIDEDLKLPSPMANRTAPPRQSYGEEEEEEPEQMEIDTTFQVDDDMGGSLEDDLEKDLECAFEELDNSQKGSPDDGDESEVSEED